MALIATLARCESSSLQAASVPSSGENRTSLWSLPRHRLAFRLGSASAHQADRPELTVAVTVQTRTAAPPQYAFKVNVPIDLSLVFKGWGPFPAVRGVENQTGAWDHVGTSRNPVLSDGTTASFFTACRGSQFARQDRRCGAAISNPRSA